VDNALKYSLAGSPVIISLGRCDVGTTIQVADQAIGIASEDMRTIFEPFFRSENARRGGTAGTGLGLALAARIARVLNTLLECESQLGKGSRFTIRWRGERLTDVIGG